MEMEYLRKKVLDKIKKNSASSSLPKEHIEFLVDWVIKTAEELWEKMGGKDLSKSTV